MKTQATLLATATILLAGCGTLTGFSDAKNSFACKAPDGVSCTSVSGVYANAQAENLPAQRKSPGSAPAQQPASAGKAATPQITTVAMPGMPIRSQQRTLRIWAAPWVDEEGDLHDQSYMYVVVESGDWLIEHTRENTVRSSLPRLRAVGKANVAEPASAAQSYASAPQGSATEGAK